MPGFDRASTAAGEARRRAITERRIEMVFVRQAAALAATALALLCASSAYAISNGVPDGDRHPGVGMFATGDARAAECTGFYAGPRADNPGEGIFLTAGHCAAALSEREVRGRMSGSRSTRTSRSTLRRSKRSRRPGTR